MLDFDQFEALTFDCYGTLIDWETGIWAALAPVLAKNKSPLGREAVLQRYAALEPAIQSGPYLPYKEVLRRVLLGLGEALGFQPTEAELGDFSTSVRDWPAFSDSAAALQALHRKYKLVILSNIDDDLFAYSAPRLGVTFDDIITAQQLHSYKPSLNNFQQAFQRLGLPPARILHVAQSLFHDHVPAQSLGMSTVWVNRAHAQSGTGVIPAVQVQPDLEVPDLQSLARIIGLM